MPAAEVGGQLVAPGGGGSKLLRAGTLPISALGGPGLGHQPTPKSPPVLGGPDSISLCSKQSYSLCLSVCKHFTRRCSYSGISLITGQAFLFKI